MLFLLTFELSLFNKRYIIVKLIYNSIYIYMYIVFVYSERVIALSV